MKLELKDELLIVILGLQDVGPAAGGGSGDEGYFVPPTKGTSQAQVRDNYVPSIVAFEYSLICI